MHVIYENHYLTDNDVAHFARQSFGAKASQYSEEQNNNLVRFLARGTTSKGYQELVENLVHGGLDEASVKEALRNWRNTPEHWVPFAHPKISLRVSAPVPIARQAFKHKVGLTESEESRRYITTTPEIYIPDFFRSKAISVKQGSDDKPHPNNTLWLDEYKGYCEKGVQVYLTMVEDGVCPEQARFILPQGVEVNWLWTGSLYAFANFFIQRSDPHAQKEIQDLAKQVGDIIEPLYPVSWAALTRADY